MTKQKYACQRFNCPFSSCPPQTSPLARDAWYKSYCFKRHNQTAAAMYLLLFKTKNNPGLCVLSFLSRSLMEGLQPSSTTPILFFTLRSSSISPLALIAADDVARNRYPAEEWRGGAVRGADPSRHLCSCSPDPSYFQPPSPPPAGPREA